MSDNQKPNLVTLTIDGQEVKVAPGTTLIKAAQKLSKDIPHFCYHEGLSVVGQCRMCFVEIEGAPKLATACSTPVGEGMKIHTASPKVKAGQNSTLEFTLLNHPLDCPICDRGGECKLQDYTYEYGPPLSRLYDDKVLREKHKAVSQQIILDQERCILCTRCVRFSSEVDGRAELVVNNRGNANVIDVFENRPIESGFSGNVVDLCPVGALTAKDFRFEARPWELKKHEAVCTSCSVGCNIEIHTKHRHMGIARPDKSLPNPVIERLVPRENRNINDWWMCDKGRWGYHFHNNDSKRLGSVLLKRNSAQIPGTLKEAQQLIDSQSGTWEFWVNDSTPSEGIAWAKELFESWKSRGRKIAPINTLDFSTKWLNVWAGKSASPWFAGQPDWTQIKKVVSVQSARDLEKVTPILALRLGQKHRQNQIQWEVREWNKSFASAQDDLASTAFLVPKPTRPEDLDIIASIPAAAKTLVLWTGTNSRGLLNHGLMPMESLDLEFKNKTPGQALFVFNQSNGNTLSPEFLNYCKKAKFLIVADSFSNSLTEIADVVLPLTPLYESQVSLTSVENIKQNSNGITIEHPSYDYLKRGFSLVNPSLRLI